MKPRLSYSPTNTNKNNVSIKIVGEIGSTIYVNNVNANKAFSSSIISYDENGNLSIFNDKEFIYDYSNRLIEVKENNKTLATYTYAAQNRRVTKILPQDNKVITYVYHKDQVIQEYENDLLTNSYVYGTYIDDPIAYQNNDNLYYYIKDRQYSIQAVTNENGNTVESYDYSSFGIIAIKDADENVISKSNINNSITYTGRRYDKESDLYYYRNRMYSPELARFTSVDPKGYVDGMNLYAYVKNNPLRFVDPMGTRSRSLSSYANTATEHLTTYGRDAITVIGGALQVSIGAVLGGILVI